MTRRLPLIALFWFFLPSSSQAANHYFWNVSGTGSWVTASNWTPARTVPAVDDILVFDGADMSPPPTTATNVPNQTFGQLLVFGGARVTLSASGGVALTINGDGGDDLVIGGGSVLALSAGSIQVILPSSTTGSITGELTAAGGAHRLLPTDAGSVIFQGGSHCRTMAGFSGNLFGNSGASDVVVFGPGSTYHHGAGLQPFGLTQPNSRVVLQTGSLVRYLANPGSGAFGGRVYGDCEFNTNPQVVVVGGSGVPVTFDNLTIISGGFSNATLPATTYHFILEGNLTVTGGGYFEIVPSSETATVDFSGTGEQSISGNGTIRLGNLSDLVVSNPTGLTLERDLFTDGSVTLSGGHLVTGSHLLHLGQTATVAGPKWVVGNLGRIIPGSAGMVTRTFEVGDAVHAAPLTMSFASVSDSGTVIARTDPGDHADLPASGLDPAQSVNRWWNVQNLGVGFTTCDVTLGFDPADVDPVADPDLFAVGKRDGGAWSLPSVGTRTATSTQALALTSFSEFAVAEEAGSVGVDPLTSSTTSLAPARPTPFHRSTVLEYSLARRGAVDLSIFDANGRRIRTLEHREHDAGVHWIGWDGRDNHGQVVPAGVYFARLVTNAGVLHRRAIKVE